MNWPSPIIYLTACSIHGTEPLIQYFHKWLSVEQNTILSPWCKHAIYSRLYHADLWSFFETDYNLQSCWMASYGHGWISFIFEDFSWCWSISLDKNGVESKRWSFTTTCNQRSAWLTLCTKAVSMRLSVILTWPWTLVSPLVSSVFHEGWQHGLELWDDFLKNITCDLEEFMVPPFTVKNVYAHCSHEDELAVDELLDLGILWFKDYYKCYFKGQLTLVVTQPSCCILPATCLLGWWTLHDFSLQSSAWDHLIHPLSIGSLWVS